jgi:hypothetical protein
VTDQRNPHRIVSCSWLDLPSGSAGTTAIYSGSARVEQSGCPCGFCSWRHSELRDLKRHRFHITGDTNNQQSREAANGASLDMKSGTKSLCLLTSTYSGLLFPNCWGGLRIRGQDKVWISVTISMELYGLRYALFPCRQLRATFSPAQQTAGPRIFTSPG